MKTYLNYSQKNNINNNLLMHKRKTQADKANKQDITIARENKELNRPARAISFGGSAGLSKTLQKGWHGLIEFANDKAVAYNAFYSLIVAGILKPMAVLKQEGSEEKDKQIIATKNFLQAFIGSFLSFTIGDQIITKAVDTINDLDLKLIKVIEDKDGVPKDVKAIEADSKKALELAKEMLIKENGKKNKDYVPTIEQVVKKSGEIVSDFSKNRLENFSKNPEFIAELVEEKMPEPSAIKKGMVEATQKLPKLFQAKYSEQTVKDGYKIFWERSTEFLTAIGKAKVSSILLPTVMALLFAKKNLEKQQQEQAKKNTLVNNSTFKMENEQFQKMLNKNNTQIAFKGKFNNQVASVIESMANSKTGAKLAHWMSSFNKPAARMGDIESIAITGYWLQNTARSKKIDPSQKLGLNVHSALVTIVSSTAAFIIDWALDFLIDKSKKKYETKLGNIIDKLIKGEVPPSLDSIFANYNHLNLKDKHKLAITDEVARAISKLKPEENFDAKAVIDTLKGYKEVFKDVNVDEGLINKIKELLESRTKFEKEIKASCEDMLNSKAIAKVLSETDLNIEAEQSKAIAKLVKKYGKSLSKFKSMTIFTLVVRFLVPVLMVPYSGKLKKKVAQWQQERQAKKAQATN